MKINKSNRIMTSNGKTKKAIIQYEFENYIIYVFQGGLSEFDILVK